MTPEEKLQKFVNETLTKAAEENKFRAALITFHEPMKNSTQKEKKPK